uniref:hybrid sensor histidine kinase/response regulator n=1 Tax=Thaumasiovibrio occultus TaxID=1891184 RepID=UPI000B34E044|nr:response regulator [Thaumasiovibrio occultus]
MLFSAYQQRLFICLCFIGLIPVSLLFWISHTKTADALQQQRIERLVVEAQQLQHRIDDEFQGVFTQLEDFAISSPIASQEHNPEYSDQVLQQFKREFPPLFGLHIVRRDRTQHSVIASSRSMSSPQLSQILAPALLNELTPMEQRQLQLSSISYEPVLEAGSSAPRQNIPITVAVIAMNHVNNETEIQHFLLAQIQLDALARAIETLDLSAGGMTGVSLLDGEAGALSGARYVLGERPPLPAELASNLSQSATSDEISIIADALPGYVGIRIPLALAGPEHKWYVDIGLRSDTPDLINQQILIFYIAIALCVLLAAFLASRFLYRPWYHLTRLSAAIKLGDTSCPPIDRSLKEVDAIADALRYTSSRINKDTVTLKQAVKKAEQSTLARSVFLANLSGELRTPVNAMLGLSRLLVKSDLTTAQHQHVESLIESGNQMAVLIDDILDFAQLEKGEFQLQPSHFCLQSVIDNLSHIYLPLASEKGLTLNIDNHCARQYLYADKARVRQIISNMLSSAIRYTHQGAITLEISTHQVQSATPQHPATVINQTSDNATEDSKELELHIVCRDSGLGISTDQLAAAFKMAEPFTCNTNEKGLGLALAKQLAEQMSGSLSIESEINRGTVVTATLGLHQGKAMTAAAYGTSTTHLSCFDGLNALIADDNSINALVLEHFLHELGIQCQLVANGQQAVAAVEHASFDLIFMDNHMPVMSGEQATIEIRRQNKWGYIPIFAFTVDDVIEAQRSMLDAGCDFVLTKPVDEKQLNEILWRYRALLPHIHYATDENQSTPSQQRHYIDQSRLLILSGHDEAQAFKQLGQFHHDHHRTVDRIETLLHRQDTSGALGQIEQLLQAADKIAATPLRSSLQSLFEAVKNEPVSANVHLREVREHMFHTLDEISAKIQTEPPSE